MNSTGDREEEELANLLSGMDDIDSKGVHGVSRDVIAVDSTDEHFALVIVDEHSTDHFLSF